MTDWAIQGAVAVGCTECAFNIRYRTRPGVQEGPSRRIATPSRSSCRRKGVIFMSSQLGKVIAVMFVICAAYLLCNGDLRCTARRALRLI